MYAYLKMEMPRTCYDCKLRRRNGLELICPVLERSYKIADTQVLFVREKDCPLIEVPEPHGRLIDADALHNAIAANIIGSRCGEETSVEIAINEAIIDDLMIIDAAPTVIPASEEE